MGVIFNVEIDKDNLIFIVHFQQNRILFVGILFLLLKKKNCFEKTMVMVVKNI